MKEKKLFRMIILTILVLGSIILVAYLATLREEAHSESDLPQATQIFTSSGRARTTVERYDDGKNTCYLMRDTDNATAKYMSCVPNGDEL